MELIDKLKIIKPQIRGIHVRVRNKPMCGLERVEKSVIFLSKGRSLIEVPNYEIETLSHARPAAFPIRVHNTVRRGTSSKITGQLSGYPISLEKLSSHLCPSY